MCPGISCASQLVHGTHGDCLSHSRTACSTSLQSTENTVPYVRQTERKVKRQQHRMRSDCRFLQFYQTRAPAAHLLLSFSPEKALDKFVFIKVSVGPFRALYRLLIVGRRGHGQFGAENPTQLLCRSTISHREKVISLCYDTQTVIPSSMSTIRRQVQGCTQYTVLRSENSQHGLTPKQSQNSPTNDKKLGLNAWRPQKNLGQI